MPHVRKSDEPLVNKAVDIYREGKVSRGDVLRDHEPVVVYLPDMTCVGLNLKEHMVGGDTTMCFDKSGKQVVYHVEGH
jgi:hypothetical protein